MKNALLRQIIHRLLMVYYLRLFLPINPVFAVYTSVANAKHTKWLSRYADIVHFESR